MNLKKLKNQNGAIGTGAIIAIAIVGIILFIFMTFIGIKNNLVTLREEVNEKQGNVQTAMQRRSDLIGNLVETVKGYTKHEESVYKDIADARSKLNGGIQSGNIDEMNAANNELNTALSRLLVVVENYPQLQAGQQYTALMDELAGTENRIATARKDYNDAVNKLNTKIKKFPSNIMAGMFGIEKAKYFEASEKSTEVPNVSFE